MKYRLQKVQNLMTKLGYTWRTPELLATAMTHTSYANENKHKALDNNQRLEFLGDAVLELVVSDYLFNRFTDYPEGSLTKIRAAVVCEPSLAKAAERLDLGEYLLLGKGEERSGGRQRPAALADAFESLVGALFLDQGLETTRSFILENLMETINLYSQGAHAGDYKSELQEFVQQFTDNELNYEILDEVGPDHNKTFTAGVFFRNEIWGQGVGRTKKEAEQSAAQEALNKMRSQRIF